MFICCSCHAQSLSDRQDTNNRHGYCKVTDIQKVSKKCRLDKNCPRVYIIFVEYLGDSVIVEKSLKNHERFRILSAKKKNRHTGETIKVNNTYYFDLISLYRPITSDIKDISYIPDDNALGYEGHLIFRLEDENIENIFETVQLNGLKYIEKLPYKQ